MTSTPQPSASSRKLADEIALYLLDGGPLEEVCAEEELVEIASMIEHLVSARVEALERRQRELIDEIVRADYSNTVYWSLTSDEVESARQRASREK